MNYSVKEYKALPPFQLPRTLGTGFTITELQGQCTNCSKVLVDLRGEVFEYAQCSDVQFAGLCNDCKLLVTCRFRYYKDGHVLTVQGETWKTMTRRRIPEVMSSKIKTAMVGFLDWIFRWRR
jgi:hypothetical protein